MINHIISQCSKLAKKENKTRHGWVGRVIHWELWKKLKFDHTNKWYIHKLASVLENEVHKFLWDFEKPTDHLISARQPDLIIINIKKRTCKTLDFAVSADHWVKLKESEKKDKYLDLAMELKKLCNMKVTFVLILVVFVLFLLHYVSAKFHLWPSSGDKPRPRIGMLSLVTVSAVITAFHSCCLSHQVLNQVNLWPDRGVESLRFQVSIVRR